MIGRLAAVAIACIAMMNAQVPVSRAPVEIAWDLVAKGKSGEAVALLQETVKKDPRNADARPLLGSILMEAGERNESISELQPSGPGPPGTGRGSECPGRSV